MRNSTDVIAQVVNGHGPKLAEVLEVSPSRCYEILSTDNPYPKTKRLIRAIAVVNRDGESFENFCQLRPVAVDAVLRDVPDHVKEKELREVIASASRHLREIQRRREPILPANVVAKAATYNGRAK